MNLTFISETSGSARCTKGLSSSKPMARASGQRHSQRSTGLTARPREQWSSPSASTICARDSETLNGHSRRTKARMSNSTAWAHHVRPNNSMQRTALRAAADAGRYAARGVQWLTRVQRSKSNSQSRFPHRLIPQRRRRSASGSSAYSHSRQPISQQLRKRSKQFRSLQTARLFFPLSKLSRVKPNDSHGTSAGLRDGLGLVVPL